MRLEGRLSRVAQVLAECLGALLLTLLIRPFTPAWFSTIGVCLGLFLFARWRQKRTRAGDSAARLRNWRPPQTS